MNPFAEVFAGTTWPVPMAIAVTEHVATIGLRRSTLQWHRRVDSD